MTLDSFYDIPHNILYVLFIRIISFKLHPPSLETTTVSALSVNDRAVE